MSRRRRIEPVTARALVGGRELPGFEQTPGDGAAAGDRAAGEDRCRPRLPAAVRRFYDDPLGWVVVGVCSLVVGYGGGAVMFWFHAVHLGEGGPAISPWLHWLVDSTAGFLALGPVVAVILPLAAAHVAARPASSPSALAPVLPTAQVAVVAGGLVAVATMPAPLLHDRLIGRGTWLAGRVTDWFGNGHHATGTSQDAAVVVEMAQQLAVGLVTYVLLVWLTLRSLRFLRRRRVALI